MTTTNSAPQSTGGLFFFVWMETDDHQRIERT